jgi:hypothetical protein
MYQSTLKHRDSRHSLRSPSVGGVVAVATAAVVGPLLAIVAISQPLLATAVVAGLLVVSGARGLRHRDGGVERDDETARAGADRLDRVMLSLRRGSDPDR